VFNIIPQAPDDFGADTWGNESWRFTGHANVWAPMTLDPARGLLYLPTSTPSSDFYGGRARGQLVRGIARVCRRRHRPPEVYFQMVHHGLWDYDNPSCAEPRDDQCPRSACRRGGAGNEARLRLRVRNRVTGAPVWPIEERPFPVDSDVPGEQPYATSAVSNQAACLRASGFPRPNDANDLTPEIKALALEEMQKSGLDRCFNAAVTARHPAAADDRRRRQLGWGGVRSVVGRLFVRAAETPPSTVSERTTAPIVRTSNRTPPHPSWRRLRSSAAAGCRAVTAA